MTIYYSMLMDMNREHTEQPGATEHIDESRSKPYSSSWRLPLPQGQFRGWILFFNVASVLILIIAIIQALLEPARGIYPNRYLAAGAILLQLGVYGWFVTKVAHAQRWPLPLRITGAYFILNVLLVCVAWLFHRSIVWLLWMYIGQMFGLLAFQVALPASWSSPGQPYSQ